MALSSCALCIRFLLAALHSEHKSWEGVNHSNGNPNRHKNEKSRFGSRPKFTIQFLRSSFLLDFLLDLPPILIVHLSLVPAKGRQSLTNKSQIFGEVPLPPGRKRNTNTSISLQRKRPSSSKKLSKQYAKKREKPNHHPPSWTGGWGNSIISRTISIHFTSINNLVWSHQQQHRKLTHIILLRQPIKPKDIAAAAAITTWELYQLPSLPFCSSMFFAPRLAIHWQEKVPRLVASDHSSTMHLLRINMSKRARLRMKARCDESWRMIKKKKLLRRCHLCLPPCPCHYRCRPACPCPSPCPCLKSKPPMLLQPFMT